MDPYQELGVSKDADDGAIKRAYQRRARKAHPDRGGKTEDFQRVNAAYRLLADPGRRAHYDQTGEADTGVDNEAAQVLNFIANLVLGVVSAVDVDHVDVMAEVRKRIKHDMKAVSESSDETKKKIRRFERALKRLSRRGGGENMIANMLRSEIAKMGAVVEQMKKNADLLERMMEFANDYEYRVDEPAPTTFITISVGS